MMPRRMYDYMRMRDGRNPYGSRGGYVIDGRRGMRDMNYGRESERGNMYGDKDYNHHPMYDMRREGREREREYMGDGRYYDPMMMQREYYDYNYMYPDYGYYGDYGKNLNREELEHWTDMLMRQVDDKDRQTFSRDVVAQKAKQMGIQMNDFNEDELLVAMLIIYTDFGHILKQYIGNNMDAYIHLGSAFLNDKDSAVRGGEKLAVYYDCIVNK